MIETDKVYPKPSWKSAIDLLSQSAKNAAMAVELMRRSMSVGLSLRWHMPLQNQKIKFGRRRPKPIRLRTRKQLKHLYSHKPKKVWNRKTRRRYPEYYRLTRFGK